MSKPQSLEGTLLQRKSRNIYGWKRRYVLLNLEDGTLSCYRRDPAAAASAPPPSRSGSSLSSPSPSPSPAGRVRKRLGGAFARGGGKVVISTRIRASAETARRRAAFAVRRTSLNGGGGLVGGDDYDDDDDDDYEGSKALSSLTDSCAAVARRTGHYFRNQPTLFLAADAEWAVADVESDPATFRVEFPKRQRMRGAGNDDGDGGDGDDGDLLRGPSEVLHFRCPGGGNEKALWLRASARIGRLSAEKKKADAAARLLRSATPEKTRRIRSRGGVEFAARTGRGRADLALSVHPEARSGFDDGDEPDGGGPDVSGGGAGDREYLVFPKHAYPYRWMTHDELVEETERPSSVFHDLRGGRADGERRGDGDAEGEDEIGALRVEVLGCVGLPKLDRLSQTDAVVYLVCGSRAFATDVVPDKVDPLWPRRSRRACVLPVHHAYAQLFAGVFDNDGPECRDGFAGRAVVDLCRLRPGCEYDVTLPLRLSEFVYRRAPRGAIRLRFRLDLTSERGAVLSYLRPRAAAMNRATREAKCTAVSVQCGDLKAYRNVVLTVHGAHLPGRYTQTVYRATTREIKLYRIMLKHILKKAAMDIHHWRSPVTSCILFLGWMHCIRMNSFAGVPAFLLSCLLLVLMRNYGKYNINPVANRGFAPLTVEEILLSLLRDGGNGRERRCMEPLEIEWSSPSGLSPWIGAAAAASDVVAPTPGAARRSRADDPLGGGLYRRMGFYDEGGGGGGGCARPAAARAATAVGDHMDFPFSRADVHGHLDVNAARVPRKKDGGGGGGGGEGASFAEGCEIDEDEFESHRTSSSELLNGAEGKSGAKKKFMPRIVGRTSPASAAGDGAKGSIADEEEEGRDRRTREGGVPPPPPPPLPEIPEQDAGVRVPRKKRLKYELADQRDRAQRMTRFVHDARLYLAVHPERYGADAMMPDSWSSGGGGGGTGGSSCHCDVPEDLEKLVADEYDRVLGISAHGNPVTAKTAEFLGPLTDVLKIGLFMFRSVFNAFMWTDPYLSFWLLLGLIVAIAFVVLFPWRVFFFVVGLVGLGPQNFALRIMRENQLDERAAKMLRRGSTFLHRKREGEAVKTGVVQNDGSPRRLKWWQKRRENKQKEKWLRRFNSATSQQMLDDKILFNHMTISDGKAKIEVPKRVHHAVIPYSPLRSNRFYDWPPDRAYASVRADKSKPVGASYSRAKPPEDREQRQEGRKRAVTFSAQDEAVPLMDPRGCDHVQHRRDKNRAKLPYFAVIQADY